VTAAVKMRGYGGDRARPARRREFTSLVIEFPQKENVVGHVGCILKFFALPTLETSSWSHAFALHSKKQHELKS
jgi:hypothetical protein